MDYNIVTYGLQHIQPVQPTDPCTVLPQVNLTESTLYIDLLIACIVLYCTLKGALLIENCVSASIVAQLTRIMLLVVNLYA
jgi:hypothetical protein